MGLFNHICKKYFSKTSKAPKSLGLLAVADKLRTNEQDSQSEKILSEAETPIVEEEPSTQSIIEELNSFFNSFCEEIGLEKCTVLFPESNLYKSFFAYGFESSLNDESISTSDFWNGTLSSLEKSQNDWYSLSDEDVNPFFQLFGDEDHNLINHLHIKKITEPNLNAIILIAETTKKSILDFDTLESISTPLLEHLQSAYQYVDAGLFNV